MHIGRQSRFAIVTLVVLFCTVGWIWYFRIYAPKHLMRQIHDVAVTVDDHLIAADTYVGQPTENEAQAYVLVHTPNVGDFLLNFESESYRESSAREYILGKQRAWFLKPMQAGRFQPPSEMRLNRYIIVSQGHRVTIQF